MAEAIQHCPTPQLAGLSAAGPCGDQPETARLGTGGGDAVKCVNGSGKKNQSGHDSDFKAARAGKAADDF